MSNVKHTRDALAFMEQSLAQSNTVNPVFVEGIKQKPFTDKEREDINAAQRVEDASIYA